MLSMNIDDEEMMPEILSTSNTKELKMFVLSALAVFSCVKIVETFFSSKGGRALWGDEAHHLNKSFQASSQSRCLRAYVKSRGSHIWGF
jgi:hypothetical protein